jgi:hypothetical protein
VKLIGGIINNNKFLCSPLVIDTCASECKKSNLSAGAAAVLGILILAIWPPSAPILNLFQAELMYVFGTNGRIPRVINDRWHLFGSLITLQLHLIRIIMISLCIGEISNHAAHIYTRAQSHILKGECQSGYIIYSLSSRKKYSGGDKWCDLGRRTT